MTFQDSLEKHLRAIRERDLHALAETLPADDGDMVLVMSDGRLVRCVREFLNLHRDWFASPTWRLEAEPLAIRESAEMAFVTLRLDYRDEAPGGGRIHERSMLSLVFARREGKWVLVFDQNTPIRSGEQTPS